MSNELINEDAGSFFNESELKYLRINRLTDFKENEVISVFYGKNQIEKLLKTKGCVGIRIFYGDEDGSPKVSLAAADKTKKLLKPDSSGLKSDGDTHLADGPECKPYCGTTI